MAVPKRCALWLFCLLLAGSRLAAAKKAQAAFGDREVLSTFPSNPGFPEGVAVFKDKAYVCGAATSQGTANRNPSTITITDLKTGAVNTVFVSGEDTTKEHQLSCCIVAPTEINGNGKKNSEEHHSLYVMSPQLGILRFDLKYLQQSLYAPPPAGGWIVGNDLIFDRQRRLFVTESNPTPIRGGGKLWMIPPGGGPPTVWLEGDPLATGFPNGLDLSPDGQKLYLTVSTTISPELGNGIVYSLPITAQPPATSALQVVHAYTNGEIPDGIRFGASGNLYVALALTPSAAPSDVLGGIDVLSPDGFPLTRLLTSNGQGPNYLNPANIAFDDKRKSVLVTNHYLACNASSPAQIDSCNFNVIRVYVGDKGVDQN
ncbi:hypothetical protein KFL_005630060 [Klebsormidium nitens]|uniref:SMP-30/Gluconolactonase/LRE-like region domain-containing protein n=1 Tax=Klebsormidium nitens TaxID=105231 RepID=A0A1Y1IGM4_KLENI|nr:hypothetical protein KFL_005630060 [Klebsormidium nitens]|eukprot:GAQ89793.1 hypothetical protein KFL_005630060 [Klebsormidium nitens]